jgi:ABC-2 type transport system permease protein
VTTMSPIALSPVGLTDRAHRVPMSRLLRVELRKMVDTRAGMWLFIAIGVITVAAVLLYLVFAPSDQLTFAGFLGATLVPQGIVLPVLGILLITSEWSQRTGLITFTLEPSRSRVLVAKTLAALLVGLAAVAIGLTTAVIGNWLALTLQGGDSAWSFGVTGLIYVLLLQVSAIVQGLAFGMLLRNSAAAIVVYFAVPIAFGLLFGLVSALRDIAPWIDLGTAQEPLLAFTDGLTGEEWAQLATTSAIWIAVPFALGFTLVRRSELKSA